MTLWIMPWAGPTRNPLNAAKDHTPGALVFTLAMGSGEATAPYKTGCPFSGEHAAPKIGPGAPNGPNGSGGGAAWRGGAFGTFLQKFSKRRKTFCACQRKRP